MRNGAVDGCRRGPITDIRGCVCDARAEFESHVETVEFIKFLCYFYKILLMQPFHTVGSS